MTFNHKCVGKQIVTHTSATEILLCFYNRISYFVIMIIILMKLDKKGERHLGVLSVKRHHDGLYDSPGTLTKSLSLLSYVIYQK